MKKTLLSILACSAVLFGLISCGAAPDETTHEAKVVDLRNKKGGTVSSIRAAGNTAVNTDFSAKFLESVPRFIGENGVETGYSFWAIKGTETTVKPSDAEFEKIKAVVKIEDHDDGIKFTFTRPEGYADKPIDWVNIQYLDDVGHKSTGIDFDKDNHATFLSTNSIEVVYPLVDPYKDESRFWIQLSNDDYYIALFYAVTPIHGHGCVDTVQEDYQIRDYLELSDEGVMSLKLTIPPVAKTGTLKHSVGLYAQSGSGNQYTEGAGTPINITQLGFFEEASAEEIAAATAGKEVEYTVDFADKFINLSAENKAKVEAVLEANPYIWASLVYKYQVNVPGLEDYVFSTPWVISNVISVPAAE